jgi:hypothetical protein
MSQEAVYEWGQRLRAEYLEMPGLALSKPQARRLWGLDAKTCDVLLEQMVSAKFLRKTSSDLYVRSDGGR